MKLSAIHIYPVKSLGGISLPQAHLTDRGLSHDRRWMLVDPQGLFISQRKQAKMALLRPELLSDGLRIRHKTDTRNPLFIPFQPPGDQRMTVSVWDSICVGQLVSPEADAWFSDALEQDCRLVYMPDETRRAVSAKRAKNGEIVSFADGYPHLIIGQASLDLLNEKLESPLPMDRFRPNFVFTGGAPHEEDTWFAFRIGGVLFRGVKPCVRCELITIDQETAVRGKEPLRTLATYRRVGNEVQFGQNLLHEGTGIVKVGDEIHIMSWQ